jgi:membrane-bound serine protease (ClpP class)
MRKSIWLAILLALLALPQAVIAGKAILLNVSGAIGPATQDYIERGIEQAAKDRANLVIIQLNTPGGLETAMRGINAAILNSPIPVVTYVYPKGARAASAGTFMLYASHVAAMAPGTNVGAAAPVQILNKSKDTKEASAADMKAANDAAAYIRSLAEMRGRNTDWAENAVRQAASSSAENAKKMKIVDILADDYPDLLKKLDGLSVNISGKNEKLTTDGMTIETVAADWRYQFLSFITNPNIAYLLLLAAIYGLFFELSNPGLILPGIVGVIALVLALYAFQLLPINYAGLALIIVGLGFILFEVYISSYGALGVGGVIAFIVGSIMLFDTSEPAFRLTLSLILAMSIVTAAFFFVIVTIAVRSHKRAIVSGKEALIGSEGVVIELMNNKILVRVSGEMWEAKSPLPLQHGEKIRVTAVNGLRLIVTPVNKQ